MSLRDKCAVGRNWLGVGECPISFQHLVSPSSLLPILGEFSLKSISPWQSFGPALFCFISNNLCFLYCFLSFPCMALGTLSSSAPQWLTLHTNAYLYSLLITATSSGDWGTLIHSDLNKSKLAFVPLSSLSIHNNLTSSAVGPKCSGFEVQWELFFVIT